MSYSIGQRTFVLLPSTDKYLTLGNEEFARTLSISNNWNRIRIGLLVAFTPNATSNLTPAALAVGMSSGVAKPYAASDTLNFFGAQLAGSGLTGTLNYNAGSGNPYYLVNAVPQSLKRVAGVTTVASLGGGATPAFASNTGAVQRRSPIYVEIDKTTTNYTVRTIELNSLNVATQFTRDYSYAHLIDGLEQDNSTPTIDGITLVSNVSPSIVNSEAAGILDTVNIFWNLASYPIEIYALAVHKFS